MKKIMIIQAALIFTSMTLQTKAQANEDMVKSEIKKPRVEERSAKKAERKELRKLEGAEVNDLAKSHFTSDFQNTSNVTWRRSVQFDEATFTKDGREMTAFYDYDANLVGTTQNKSFSDLSAIAQKKIKKEYKGYKIGKVIFFDDNEANETDMILHDIQFDDEDLYFVTLEKAGKKIIVMVNKANDVSYFTTIK